MTPTAIGSPFCRCLSTPAPKSASASLGPSSLFLGFLKGAIVPTLGNCVAMLCDAPITVGFSKKQHDDFRRVSSLRNLDVFQARVDDLRREARKIRSKPTGNPDAAWLAAVTEAWRICFRHPGDAAAEARAKALAHSVGEDAYFDAHIRKGASELRETWALIDVLKARFRALLPYFFEDSPSGGVLYPGTVAPYRFNQGKISMTWGARIFR